MSLVPTFASVRTKIRGEPYELNSLPLLCEMVERGSKVSAVIKSNEQAVPCPISQRKGKRTGEDPAKPLSPSTPWLVETKRKQVKRLAYSYK